MGADSIGLSRKPLKHRLVLGELNWELYLRKKYKEDFHPANGSLGRKDLYEEKLCCWRQGWGTSEMRTWPHGRIWALG